MAKDGYPMEPTRVDPETWATPATAWDVRKYGDVEVQFVTTPGTPYQPQRSLDGATYVNCNAYDASGNPLATITAAGIYSFDGAGYLKFSAGAGSTLTRRAAA
jgi:hypothetical protein